jgi:hydrogenase maturation protease
MSPAHMARILIVGIGNRLRSDDGVGWQLASELSREVGRDDVHIISTQQLAPEVAEIASRAQRVLFVDAATKSEPGTLNFSQITPASSSRHSHELTPAGVLKLAQDLYDRCPPAYLLTIGGESFDTGDSLSASVVAALPEAKAEIARFIAGKGVEID